MDNNRISIAAIGNVTEITPIYLQVGEATIEVLPRIPYALVLDMIQFCIDWTINDRPFISAPLQKLVRDFAVLRFYTNLDTSGFESGAELSEMYSQYDVLLAHDVIADVERRIDANQLHFFDTTLEKTLASINEYRNSAQGIVDAISDAAKGANNDVEQAMNLLGDEEKLQKVDSFLKMVQSVQSAPN